jgi:hypothetical protein
MNSTKTGGELRCFGMVSSSCSTSATRRVKIIIDYFDRRFKVSVLSVRRFKVSVLSVRRFKVSVLSVRRFTDSEYHCGIFKLS